MTMDLGRLGRLICKELSEILRDRRTIVTLVLMPLLLYPLLSVAFQQFLLGSGITPSQGIEYRIGFASPAERDSFGARLSYGDQLLQARAKVVKDAPQAKGEPKLTFR